MPCDVLLPPDSGPDLPKKLCIQNFPSLPPAIGCFGDSGGPMVVCKGDRIVVIGVSAYGRHPTEHTCKNDNFTVGAYMEVQAYLPWIRKTIGEGNNSENKTTLMRLHVQF